MEAKKYIQLLKNNLDIQWFPKNSNSSDELRSYLDETQGIVVKEINGFTIIIKYDIDSMNSETEKFTVTIFILILVITELVGLIIVRLLKRIILNPMVKEMRHIQSISEKDGMTELYNKYRLNSKICYYNSCSTLGVIFVDVNDLKKANDSYGHDVGNELICKVSNAMKTLQFSNLECYRVGGDEFVMVLPNCSKQKLKKVKEDFLENIEKITLKLAPIQVTVACGVSYQDKSIDIDRAIKLADQAMYRCKNMQKN